MHYTSITKWVPTSAWHNRTATLSILQMGKWLEKFSHFSNKIRTQTWQPLQSSHLTTTASKIWDTGILHIGDLLPHHVSRELFSHALLPATKYLFYMHSFYWVIQTHDFQNLNIFIFPWEQFVHLYKMRRHKWESSHDVPCCCARET